MQKQRKALIWRLIIYTVAVLSLFAYLLFFEAKGSGIPCLIKRRFGITCPSCGATRALFSLLKGDFSAAKNYHMIFAYALYPMLFLIFLQDLLISILRVAKKKPMQTFLEFLLGIMPVHKQEYADKGDYS